LDEEFSKNCNTFAKYERVLPQGFATIFLLYQNESW
jgi:hypothetical protein